MRVCFIDLGRGFGVCSDFFGFYLSYCGLGIYAGKVQGYVYI